MVSVPGGLVTGRSPANFNKLKNPTMQHTTKLGSPKPQSESELPNRTPRWRHTYGRADVWLSDIQLDRAETLRSSVCMVLLTLSQFVRLWGVRISLSLDSLYCKTAEKGLTYSFLTLLIAFVVGANRCTDVPIYAPI